METFVSKSNTSYELPSSRLDLIIPRQHYQLGTKCSNAQDYGGHFLLKISDHPTSIHLLATGFCLTLTCFMSTKLMNWFLCLNSFDVHECFCLKVWGNFWWDSGVGQIWALLGTQSCMFQMWANFPSCACCKGNPSSLVLSLSKSSDKEHSWFPATWHAVTNRSSKEQQKGGLNPASS